jgi:hypothetical protein
MFLVVDLRQKEHFLAIWSIGLVVFLGIQVMIVPLLCTLTIAPDGVWLKGVARRPRFIALATLVGVEPYTEPTWRRVINVNYFCRFPPTILAGRGQG